MWEKESNPSKKMWVREYAWTADHKCLIKNARIVIIPKIILAYNNHEKL